MSNDASREPGEVGSGRSGSGRGPSPEPRVGGPGGWMTALLVGGLLAALAVAYLTARGGQVNRLLGEVGSSLGPMDPKSDHLRGAHPGGEAASTEADEELDADHALEGGPGRLRIQEASPSRSGTSNQPGDVGGGPVPLGPPSSLGRDTGDPGSRGGLGDGREGGAGTHGFEAGSLEEQ